MNNNDHSIVNISANKKIKYKWNKRSNQLTITWDHVFHSEHPLFYEVSAGSYEGAADVLQWQETMETQAIFVVPQPRYSDSKQIFLTVRSISPSGTFSTTNTEAFATF